MTSLINNTRDLLGYALDLVDVLLIRHRRYGYCQFVAGVFSDADETAVSRLLQPFFEKGER